MTFCCISSDQNSAGGRTRPSAARRGVFALRTTNRDAPSLITTTPTMTGVSGDDKNNSEVFQLFHRGVCLSDAPRRYPLGRLSSPRPGWTGWVCRETGRARQPTMRKGKRSDHDRGQVIAVRREAFSEKGENDGL